MTARDAELIALPAFAFPRYGPVPTAATGLVFTRGGQVDTA